jgi:hypothetical protein
MAFGYRFIGRITYSQYGYDSFDEAKFQLKKFPKTELREEESNKGIVYEILDGKIPNSIRYNISKKKKNNS